MAPQRYSIDRHGTRQRHVRPSPQQRDGTDFRAGGISTTFLGSHVLSGSKPAVVSQGDVENMVKRLFRAGKLKNFDLSKTGVNFFLPSGTLLNTDEAPTSGAVQLTAETGKAPATPRSRTRRRTPPRVSAVITARSTSAIRRTAEPSTTRSGSLLRTAARRNRKRHRSLRPAVEECRGHVLPRVE